MLAGRKHGPLIFALGSQAQDRGGVARSASGNFLGGAAVPYPLIRPARTLPLLSVSLPCLLPPSEALPPWEVLPGSRPEVPAYRVALALRPGAKPARYAVHSSWAEAGAGPTRRTRLERTVDLHVAARPGGQLLTLRTTAPRLKPPARTAFDTIALLLADLYAELVFDLAPTGELRGLANGAAIGQQWAHVRQALARQYPADSEVVAALVAGVSRQPAAGAAGRAVAVVALRLPVRGAAGQLLPATV